MNKFDFGEELIISTPSATQINTPPTEKKMWLKYYNTQTNQEIKFFMPIKGFETYMIHSPQTYSNRPRKGGPGVVIDMDFHAPSFKIDFHCDEGNYYYEFRRTAT